jgi:hypothetical protein
MTLESMPDALTIARGDLVDVASGAECIFGVFTVLTGRTQNDLSDRMGELVDKIVRPFAVDGIDDEVRLRGSEKAIRWLDALAKDERGWLERYRTKVNTEGVDG